MITGQMVINLIKQHGFEQGVTRVLTRMAEELADHERTYKAMAEAFDALTRVQTMLNGVADGLKTDLDKIKGGRNDGDERSTAELVRDKH